MYNFSGRADKKSERKWEHSWGRWTRLVYYSNKETWGAGADEKVSARASGTGKAGAKSASLEGTKASNKGVF